MSKFGICTGSAGGFIIKLSRIRIQKALKTKGLYFSFCQVVHDVTVLQGFITSFKKVEWSDFVPFQLSSLTKWDRL